MKYHLVYKTTNLINNKYYIGVHSTNKIKDYYKGSGHVIKSALKKYGFKNFLFKILQFCETREEALELEKLIVTEKFLNSPDVYNIRIGGYGGVTTHTNNSREKISKSKIGIPRSEETKNKIRESLKGRKQSKETLEKRKGWKHTPEAITKIRNASKKRRYSKEVIEKRNKSRSWYRHSEQTKEKMRQKALNRLHK